MRTLAAGLSLIALTLSAAADDSGAPAPPPDWLARADAAFNAQDWAGAAAAYRRVVEANAKNGRAWFRLGYALHAARDFDAAIGAHKRAAAFPRFRPVALYNLACAQCLKGDLDAAFASLQQAVAAGYRAPKRLSTDADLKPLAAREGFAALEERALPPKLRAVYRQFDFWVGKWAVTNPAGKRVGTNVITASDAGFLLTEKWTSSTNNTGSSVNFFDPADGKWHQIWVDDAGNVTRYAGAWSNGAMRFIGQSCTAEGKKAPRRMTFTPRKDGTVRQLIEKSGDGGQTWTVDFDGIYTRQ
jgi:hypothetical protein